jgi:hypothetical protein
MINVGVLNQQQCHKEIFRHVDSWSCNYVFFPDIFYQRWNKTNYEMKTSATEPSVRSGNGGMTMGVISILP